MFRYSLCILADSNKDNYEEADARTFIEQFLTERRMARTSQSALRPRWDY